MRTSSRYPATEAILGILGRRTDEPLLTSSDISSSSSLSSHIGTSFVRSCAITKGAISEARYTRLIHLASASAGQGQQGGPFWEEEENFGLKSYDR